MSLQDPTKKMSKSDEDANNYVSLLDPAKKIEKKIKSAVTDSETPPRVYFDLEKKPGISNLMTMYSALTGKSYAEIEKSYEGKMYGHFKTDLAEIVVQTLSPVQETYNQLMADPGQLLQILKKNQSRANEKAQVTLRSVYQKIGLVVV
jgi:tryptophanyl-tRNA synthetase